MVLAIVASGALAAAQQTQPASTQPAATQPARTQPARTQPASTQKTETRPARTQPAATQTHEPSPATLKLIQLVVKSAKDDADAAAKLIAAAKLLKDDPNAQVTICEAAYDYGAKGAAGFGSALQALSILNIIAPQRGGAWAEKRMKVYRLRYAAASEKDKRQYAPPLIRTLVRVGDAKTKGGNAKEAADFYREALAIATRIRLPGRKEISAKLLGAIQLLQLQGTIDRLKAKLADNPGDKASRNSLIHMYLFRLQSPGEAAKYVNDDCDESLRKHVPLATKPLAEAKDADCLALGQWYRSLSLQAPKADKIRMLETAQSYLRRFLDIHSAKDVARTKVVMLLRQVDAAIVKLGGRLTELEGAVLVLTFETNTLFTQSGVKYIRDVSGKGNNGRVTGGALGPGKAGSAMKFDKKSHINVGNPKDLQITGGQTICMWIKVSSLASRQNPINKAYGGEGTWTLERNGAINYWYGSSGADASPYKGYKMSTPLAVGTWAHVATVRDMKARKVIWYKDGVAVSTTTAAHTCAASSKNLLIGTGYTGGLSGMLDEVAFFNRALSAEEIQKIYKWGVQGRPLAR